MRTLFEHKNKHYGDSTTETFKEFGLVSYTIRLNDKMRRLRSLTKLYDRSNQDTPAFIEAEDSILDTLFDMANYAILALIDLNDEIDKQAVDLPMSRLGEECSGSVSRSGGKFYV